VKLTAGKEAHPGETIRVGIKPVVEGRAAFLLWHCELLGPDGEFCRWARSSATASDPSIHFALDDPEGTYTLEVHEVLTGTRARTQIELTKTRMALKGKDEKGLVSTNNSCSLVYTPPHG